MNIDLKFQVINCLYWVYTEEERLLYTDTCNILDSILFYFQHFSAELYLGGIKNKDIYSLDETGKLRINPEFKAKVRAILEEAKIINTFGFITFDESNKPDAKEYGWWLSENEVPIKYLKENRLISNKTKLKIQEILRSKTEKKEILKKTLEL